MEAIFWLGFFVIGILFLLAVYLRWPEIKGSIPFLRSKPGIKDIPTYKGRPQLIRNKFPIAVELESIEDTGGKHHIFFVGGGKDTYNKGDIIEINEMQNIAGKQFYIEKDLIIALSEGTMKTSFEKEKHDKEVAIKELDSTKMRLQILEKNFDQKLDKYKKDMLEAMKSGQQPQQFGFRGGG